MLDNHPQGFDGEKHFGLCLCSAIKTHAHYTTCKKYQRVFLFVCFLCLKKFFFKFLLEYS